MKRNMVYGLFGAAVLASIVSLGVIFASNSSAESCRVVLAEGDFELIDKVTNYGFETAYGGEHRLMLVMDSDKPFDFDRLFGGKSGVYSFKAVLRRGEDVVSVGRFNKSSPPESTFYDENSCTVYLATFEAEPGASYSLVLDIWAGSQEFKAMDAMQKVLRVDDVSARCEEPPSGVMINLAIAVFVLSAIGMIVLGLKVRKAGA